MMVRAFDSRFNGRGFDSRSFHFRATTCQPWASCSYIRGSVTKRYNFVRSGQGAVMPCGWVGNRRSGVALAMCNRLHWFIHLRAHGLRKEDEQPAYTLYGV